MRINPAYPNPDPSISNELVEHAKYFECVTRQLRKSQGIPIYGWHWSTAGTGVRLALEYGWHWSTAGTGVSSNVLAQ